MPGLVNGTCSVSYGPRNTTTNAVLAALPSSYSNDNGYLESQVQIYASGVGAYYQCPTFKATAVTTTIASATRLSSTTAGPAPGSSSARVASSTQVPTAIHTVTPQAAPNSQTSGPGSGPQVGIAAGALIGAVVVVSLTLILWRQLRRRRRGRASAKEQTRHELEANEMQRRVDASTS